MVSVLIALLVCACMIALILVKPVIRVKNYNLSIYWLPAFAGACLLVALGQISLREIGAGLLKDSEVNPIKILVLFFSMTLISMFLDNTGFFSYLAMSTMKRAGSDQKKLFLSLYAVVSVLTVFTSNDIIVLTFTPFICYFSKNAHIDPKPYLICEFIAANTWSMALIVGNPTNIYLSGAAGVGFMQYLKVMLLPTLCAGIASLIMLLLLFRKPLSVPMQGGEQLPVRLDRPLMWMGLSFLGGCILLMTVSQYLSLPMWIISLGCFLGLYLLAAVYLFVCRKPFLPVFNALKRAPVEIIPFILSMFVVVLALTASGATDKVTKLLEKSPVLFTGVSSFLAANLINNIPMSVLFSAIVEPMRAGRSAALFSAVIGSNLGAYFTPIGALAGIMWTGMLRDYEVKLSFPGFIRLCAPVALVALAAALAVLGIA